MTTITATDFKKHFGVIADQALREEVIIKKHERNSLVLLAFDHFMSLKNRIAELEDEKLAREIAQIKKTGEFISGNEATELLKSMIV